MDSDYLALVSKLRRVRRETKTLLPAGLNAQLLGRIEWLRRTVLRLDTELGVTFPLIVVGTAFRQHSFPDGSTGIVHSAVGPFPSKWGAVWSVWLNPASLIALEEEAIEGVLAHEFLHYVWESIRTSEGLMDSTTDALDRDYAYYKGRDQEAMVTESHWLTPRLWSLKARAEAIDASLEGAQLRDWILNEWKPVGAAVELIDPRYKCAGKIMVDEDLVARGNVKDPIG
jgi:hypothetical protein